MRPKFAFDFEVLHAPHAAGHPTEERARIDETVPVGARIPFVGSESGGSAHRRYISQCRMVLTNVVCGRSEDGSMQVERARSASVSLRADLAEFLNERQS